MANDRTEGPDSAQYSQDDRPSGERSAFASEPASVPKKKGMGNLILLGVGVLFVGFVALVGWKMLATKAPVARAPVSASATPAATAPAATAPTDATPANADPIGPTTDPLAPVDPASSGLDPATGLPLNAAPDLGGAQTAPDIDPATGLPVAAPATAPVVDPTVAPAAVDPNAALPNGGAPVAVVPNPSAANTTPVAITAPAAQPSPSVTQPVATPVEVAPAAAPSASDGAAFAQVRTDILGALDRFQESLTSLDKRVSGRMDEFERRLSALEGSPRTSAPAQASTKPAVRRAVVRAKPRNKPPVRVASHVAVRPSAPANRVEIITHADAPAAPQVIAAPVVSRPSGCSIASIQPGRFWVRSDDGSFSTYGVDDRIGGGRVTRVDPDAGVFVDGRRWNCGG